MKRQWQFMGILSAVIVAVVVLVGYQSVNSPVQHPYTATPTLLLHGFGGSAASTDNLINSAVSAGAATRTLRATVAPNGKVSLSGNWPRNAKNPLIQLVFQNSRSQDRSAGGIWIKNVLTALHQRYRITKFNFIAHSRGNVDLLNYETRFAKTAGQPQLQNMVNIAAPVNGILGMEDRPNRIKIGTNGKPSIETPLYRSLLQQMSNFPKNQVAVLNIYGNLDDGSNSDSSVSNASAESMRYLLRGRAKSYQTLVVHGKQAQHSALTRNNAQVTKAINQFLFKVDRAN